jgi:NADH:ubiquinone oxidoreductase subunit 2 (subunit N)
MIQHGNNFYFFCSIASMILGALAAMAQNKIKKLLALLKF